MSVFSIAPWHSDNVFLDDKLSWNENLITRVDKLAFIKYFDQKHLYKNSFFRINTDTFLRKNFNHVIVW